jgi:hypothetical protein
MSHDKKWDRYTHSRKGSTVTTTHVHSDYNIRGKGRVHCLGLHSLVLDGIFSRGYLRGENLDGTEALGDMSNGKVSTGALSHTHDLTLSLTIYLKSQIH